ncbi:hypothetical protein [Serratia quinivorans]|uniref:hypothetical protein n=1 Tax=Serratia quinivorans TaxID=137545 RepID=UPI002E772382|nr:hypothetical protein [Serratia quinivorans]
MTEKHGSGRLPGGRAVTEMMKGILPGLTLCLLTVMAARAMPAPETFLPEQDITISGKVTAPSCQAMLKENMLQFQLDTSGGARGFSPGGEERKNADTRQQVMSLELSECEFDGLGVRFQAESLPGFPARGGLRGVLGGELNTSTWYTVGPGVPFGKDELVLKLAADSPALETGQPGETYFRLNQEEYWFDASATLQAGEAMQLPFVVQMHSAPEAGAEKPGEDLEARFTLQLSWR